MSVKRSGELGKHDIPAFNGRAGDNVDAEEVFRAALWPC